MGMIRKVVGGLFYGGVLGFSLLAGTAAGYIGRSPMIQQLVHDTIIPPDPKEVFKEGDSLTLLLLGCDEDRWPAGELRPDGTRGVGTLKNGSPIKRKYGRADMILIARLDFNTKKITGLSIPRDVRAELEPYGWHKINAFHSLPPEDKADDAMRDVVEKTLGIEIDRTIALNYDAFKAMVDRVGGVPVTIEKPMHYDDAAGDLHIHFEPGPKTLNGEDAMGYVRFRKDAGSDFARQDRQKKFLSAFRSQVAKNPTALADVAELGVQVLNGKLNEREISALAMFSRGIPTDGIKMGMVPIREGKRRGSLYIDEEKLPATLKEFGFTPGARS